MRAKIAEHMMMSKRTSAHVTTVHKTDMTKIAKMRERHKAEFQQRYGYSLTYLPFVIAAAVEAIRALSRSSTRPSKATTSSITTKSISGSRWRSKTG